MTHHQSLEMNGCRRALTILNAPERMEQMICVIEDNIEERPSLVFDACKSIIEYTCKNILRYTNSGYDDNWDLPKFIRETAKSIRLTPENYEGDSVAGPIFQKIVQGLTTAVQNFGELRSKEGLLAHGAIGYSRQLEATHARFAAYSVDALIELLVYSSRNYWSNLEEDIQYEDNNELNELIDQSFSVVDDEDGYFGMISPDGTEIFRLRKSDLLYKLDKDQYISLIAEADQSEDEE
ncbi:abortive infection family protein [Deinococcus soli (ex Cha et al. 2016)]|uniref:Uncharacterized protein n=2 Tax=Deinococcus soli (ex Cha et al. 2016) TaxID=1309411 RepID=A0ACC6KM86_9DEIO|nr:abortive infection family protein [Deinococcus soli (ex Cha et al. 2016)]MDR6221198.1 hypothetical protein [Deinococcus soli (ex Cha et al. 2016)]MDR6331131.1 hypothetical protein [Deinococcus soli (ex Cha et al. 2016)]MDR6753739.1 hypothetical protein [Deinococcus soli (ex Cha et al. 2016)]